MAGGNLAALNVKLTADASQYTSTFKAASDALSKFAKDQAESLKALGTSLTEAFSAVAITEFVEHAFDAIGSLNQLSQAAGVSVEAITGLQLAAASGGVNLDQLGESFKKLNESISSAAGDSTGKAASAFQALGISVTNADGTLKSVSDLLPEIANKFQASADGPNKVAIAIDLLGKQGQALIPVLNGGAEGLAEFQQKASDAGLVISGELAKSVDDFNTQTGILKTQLVDGLGVQIASQLLPVLKAVSENISANKDTFEALGLVAGALVGVLKYVALSFLEIQTTVVSVGKVIVGVVTAIRDMLDATKDLSASADDLKKGFGGAFDTIANGANTALKVFQANTEAAVAAAAKAAADDKLLQPIQVTATKTNLQSPEAIQKANEASKSLKEYNDNLHDQAAAFGLGSAALVNYNLQSGKLSEELALINKVGGDTATIIAKIKANAATLQFKQASKEVDDLRTSLVTQIATYDDGDLAAYKYTLETGKNAIALKSMGAAGITAKNSLLALKGVQIGQQDAKAVQAINVELEEMAGHLSQAAVDSFQLQNALLIKNVNSSGTQADKDALAAKQAVIKAQGDYNELQQQAAIIQQNYANVEATVNLEEANGQKTTLAGQAELSAARTTELEQLQKIYAQEGQIASDNATTIPKLTQDTQAFGNTLKQLATDIDPITKQIRGDLEDAFSNSLLEAETGAKSFKAAFSDMAKSIENDLLKIANKNIAESLFGSSGSLGGLSSGLAGLFGGGGSGTSGIASTGAAAAGISSDDLASSIAVDLPGFASGGTVPAGQLAVVGENGPELAYSGAKDMNIIPNHEIGGTKPVQVTNHFVIQSNNGTISRQSQMQTGANVARSLAAANARNNRG